MNFISIIIRNVPLSFPMLIYFIFFFTIPYIPSNVGFKNSSFRLTNFFIFSSFSLIFLFLPLFSSSLFPILLVFIAKSNWISFFFFFFVPILSILLISSSGWVFIMCPYYRSYIFLFSSILL